MVCKYYFGEVDCFCLQCDSAQQLINVRQLRVVKYRYDPEFSNHCGLDTQSDTGIIAQELRNILPEAVMPAGDIILPSGTRIDNFLVVNKVINQSLFITVKVRLDSQFTRNTLT